jgi:23S rRNA pseudouridine2457 synthase
LRLVRVSIGSLSLQGLSLGEWRELTANEVKMLKKN